MTIDRSVTLSVGSEFIAWFGKTPEEVVMAIRRPGGKFLVAGKSYYPPGT